MEEEWKVFVLEAARNESLPYAENNSDVHMGVWLSIYKYSNTAMITDRFLFLPLG